MNLDKIFNSELLYEGEGGYTLYSYKVKYQHIHTYGCNRVLYAIDGTDHDLAFNLIDDTIHLFNALIKSII